MDKELQNKIFAVCAGLSEIPDSSAYPNPDQRLLPGMEDAKVIPRFPNPLSFIEHIGFDGYAEPGYADPKGAIVTANWNHDKEKIIRADFVDPDEDDSDEMHTVAEALEKLGCEIEWSDEWDTCSNCNKLVRTSGNSYHWTRFYWSDAATGDCICGRCIEKDESLRKEYVDSHIGNLGACLTIPIDLEEYDFVRLPQDFESGWHPGQNADPKKIAVALRARGIQRFVFNLDSVGQFDAAFSVWIDKSYDLRELSQNETRADVSPGEQLRLYLQSAATIPVPQGNGVAVFTPDRNNPTKAVVRLVSPEDFIAGKAFDDGLGGRR